MWHNGRWDEQMTSYAPAIAVHVMTKRWLIKVLFFNFLKTLRVSLLVCSRGKNLFLEGSFFDEIWHERYKTSLVI